MSFQGHAQNGVVVFDEPVSLPEGAQVRVEPVTASSDNRARGKADWEAALQAAREIEHYDFDAWRKQRDADLEDSRNRLP